MFDLTALVEEFLEYLEVERNLSPLTIRDYRHYLNHFVLVRFFDFFGKPLGKFRVNAVLSFAKKRFAGKF